MTHQLRRYLISDLICDAWQLENHVATGIPLPTIAVDKLTVYNHNHPFEGQIQHFLSSLNNFAAIPFFTVHSYDILAGSVADTKRKCSLHA